MNLEIMKLIFLLLIAVSGKVDASEYRDTSNGFSLQIPQFDAIDSLSAQVLTIAGPPTRGFAPNCNVQIQAVNMSLDDFVELTLRQFEGAGFEVIESSRIGISGRDAQRWHYNGSLHGTEFEWLAVVVPKSNRFFLLTCTALKDKYEETATIFEDTIQSFRVD